MGRLLLRLLPMLCNTLSLSSCVSRILFCSIISFCSYCCFRVCRRRWLFSSSSISFCLMAISHVMLARSAWTSSAEQEAASKTFFSLDGQKSCGWLYSPFSSSSSESESSDVSSPARSYSSSSASASSASSWSLPSWKQTKGKAQTKRNETKTRVDCLNPADLKCMSVHATSATSSLLCSCSLSGASSLLVLKQKKTPLIQSKFRCFRWHWRSSSELSGKKGMRSTCKWWHTEWDQEQMPISQWSTCDYCLIV